MYSKENELGPLEVTLRNGHSSVDLDIAIRKLNKLVSREGVMMEYMWRRHHRPSRESKQKFKK
jgi:ribosomal protein S21